MGIRPPASIRSNFARHLALSHEGIDNKFRDGIIASIRQVASDSPHSLPKGFSAEMEALALEPEAQGFFHGLLGMGRRLKASGQAELASLVLSAMVQALRSDNPAAPPNHPELARLANRELEAILGRGSLGMRVEFLAANFATEVTHPVGIFAMGVGGFAYKTFRLGVLGRLLSNGPGSLTRGFGARALAATSGFCAEVPAFVFSGRAANQALGIRQDKHGEGIADELLSAGSVLSALKLSGAAATRLYHHVPTQFTGRSLLPRSFPQAAMLAGILAGLQVEEQLGIRPSMDGATTLVDSLALLVRFNISGHLLETALGPRFGSLQRRLHLQSELLARQGPNPPWPSSFAATNPAARRVPLAAALHEFAILPRANSWVPWAKYPQLRPILMAGDQGEGDGGSKGPRNVIPFRPPSRPRRESPKETNQPDPSPEDRSHSATESKVIQFPNSRNLKVEGGENIPRLWLDQYQGGGGSDFWRGELKKILDPLLIPDQSLSLDQELVRLPPPLLRVLWGISSRFPRQVLLQVLYDLKLMLTSKGIFSLPSPVTPVTAQDREAVAHLIQEDYKILFGANPPLNPGALMAKLNALSGTGISLLFYWGQDPGSRLLMAQRLGVEGLPAESEILEAYYRWESSNGED